MLAGIAHNLGGGVKAHRLRVQQGTGKDSWVMAFQPRRDIDQKREADCVAFRKAIVTETLDLVETTLREIKIIAAIHHSVNHQFF